MSDIKWIKLTTDMFADEKINYIESLPDCDTILVIWVKLLTFAGKCNAGGFIMLTENIPYTDQMLSHKFQRPLNSIKLALDTFFRLGMIEITEQGIYITNWEKHQNVDRMEEIREYNKLAKRKEREKKKLNPPQENVNDISMTMSIVSSSCHDTDIDIDKELDIENIYNPVIEYLNLKAGTKYKPNSQKTKDLIKARQNEGFIIEDFYKAIDNKVTEWKGTDWEKFLRPETLFSNKFEGYLNQVIKGANAKQKYMTTDDYDKMVKEADIFVRPN